MKDGDGYAWMHEFDDYADDDEVAMPVHIELAPTDIDNGNRSVDIFGFIPDMQRQTGDFTLTITAKDHPRGDDLVTDILTISPTDKLVDARVGGRQFSLKLELTELGCDFRMGRWGIEVQAPAPSVAANEADQHRQPAAARRQSFEQWLVQALFEIQKASHDESLSDLATLKRSAGKTIVGDGKKWIAITAATVLAALPMALKMSRRWGSRPTRTPASTCSRPA